MYITYHRDIEKQNKVVNTIPHGILNKELQDFIIRLGVEQKHYFFYDNGFYWFLYLDNGSRIDVTL